MVDPFVATHHGVSQTVARIWRDFSTQGALTQPTRLGNADCYQLADLYLGGVYRSYIGRQSWLLSKSFGECTFGPPVSG